MPNEHVDIESYLSGDKVLVNPIDFNCPHCGQEVSLAYMPEIDEWAVKTSGDLESEH